MRVRSFPPVSAPDARVLVLGSMPGEASLAAGEYYAHPRNLFWPIMGVLAGAHPALPYERRIDVLRASGIALWDVMASCVRPGSLDASIRPASVVANDFAAFLATHPSIAAIFFNGATAETAFRRHALPTLAAAPPMQRLPSTSPAHAALGFEAKLEAWRAALAPVPRATAPRRR